MKTIEKEGKILEQIINDFKEETNLVDGQFKYEILDEGSKGLFNMFGVKPMQVRFSILELEDKLGAFLENLLKKMNVEFGSIDVKKEDNIYYLTVLGALEPGFVIGKQANLMNNIQHLLYRILDKEHVSDVVIKLDVDGYRQRKEETLMSRIDSIANRVIETKRNYTLNEMSAADRRVVHQHIEKNFKLKTMTIGSGELKRIVIMPHLDHNGFRPNRRPNFQHRNRDGNR